MDDKQLGAIIGSTLMIAIIGGIAWVNHQEKQRQDALLAGGTCKVEITDLYQPPPTQHCTYRNASDHCEMWKTYQADSYFRDLYVCGDGSEFWRKTNVRKPEIVSPK